MQVAPTPLTRLKWWRVVMDEAQMVERPSHAAALARQLEATHRWAISGTPVSSGLSDIGGLLLFLRAAPWDDGSTWACSVVNPCNQGLTMGKAQLNLAICYKAAESQSIWILPFISNGGRQNEPANDEGQHCAASQRRHRPCVQS